MWRSGSSGAQGTDRIAGAQKTVATEQVTSGQPLTRSYSQSSEVWLQRSGR